MQQVAASANQLEPIVTVVDPPAAIEVDLTSDNPLQL